MIDIQTSRIPGSGATSPWDVAAATVDGVAYRERSRTSSLGKLARTLVAAGVPDQPWQSFTPGGTRALRGPSIHRMAKLTIEEGDRGIRWRKYAPHPRAGVGKNGSEPPG